MQNLRKLVNVSQEQKTGFKIGWYIIKTIITICLIIAALNFINQPDYIEFFGGISILIVLIVYYLPKAIRMVHKLKAQIEA